MDKKDIEERVRWLTEEKIKRLKKIFETPVDRPFMQIHELIEKIMDRPVWTHEMAFPELLYEELRSGKRGSAFGKATKKLAEKKPVIVVEFPGGDTHE